MYWVLEKSQLKSSYPIISTEEISLLTQSWKKQTPGCAEKGGNKNCFVQVSHLIGREGDAKVHDQSKSVENSTQSKRELFPTLVSKWIALDQTWSYMMMSADPAARVQPIHGVWNTETFSAILTMQQNKLLLGSYTNILQLFFKLKREANVTEWSGDTEIR